MASNDCIVSRTTDGYDRPTVVIYNMLCHDYQHTLSISDVICSYAWFVTVNRLRGAREQGEASVVGADEQVTVL